MKLFFISRDSKVVIFSLIFFCVIAKLCEVIKGLVGWKIEAQIKKGGPSFVHGTGGFLGCILTGIFADSSIVSMVGDTPIKGGWINGNYIQVCYQLLSAAAAAAWSFAITFVILQIIGLIPCISLKLTEHEEHIGSDWIELGEQPYGHDVKQFDDEYLSEIKRISKRESNLSILRSYFNSKRAKHSNDFQMNRNGIDQSINDANKYSTSNGFKVFNSNIKF